MVEGTKLERYEAIFKYLSESNQDYVIAIQQALLFAQNTLSISNEALTIKDM